MEDHKQSIQRQTNMNTKNEKDDYIYKLFEISPYLNPVFQ